jgi:choline transport protein
VYHWATVAGGKKYGRVLGFFTGWINFYGWMFDLAALAQITANIAVSIYTVSRRGTYESDPWHVYIAYLLIVWGTCLLVIFANGVVPYTQKLGGIFVCLGGVAVIIVLAVMPRRHASSQFVWGSFEENNLTGWSSGVAFLLGVLNGAFTIGTPDSITHLSEELPNPRKDVPRAMLLQIGTGFLCKELNS